jgi:hypothetical protein
MRARERERERSESTSGLIPSVSREKAERKKLLENSGFLVGHDLTALEALQKFSKSVQCLATFAQKQSRHGSRHLLEASSSHGHGSLQ